MTRMKASARIYTVVEVWRGFASGAHNFLCLKDALLCMERLCEGRNLQDDDVQVFETKIDPCRRRHNRTP